MISQASCQPLFNSQRRSCARTTSWSLVSCPWLPSPALVYSLLILKVPRWFWQLWLASFHVTNQFRLSSKRIAMKRKKLGWLFGAFMPWPWCGTPPSVLFLARSSPFIGFSIPCFLSISWCHKLRELLLFITQFLTHSSKTIESTLIKSKK